MDITQYAYGNWIIVFSIILVGIFFISKYIPLKTKMQKRGGGVLIAFVIALFTEMYGFPLTIYFLSSFFGLQIPLTHEYGHLFAYLLTFLGINILMGWFLVMAISTILIGMGILLIIDGWKKVYNSKGKLVTDGIYSKIRHPQYTGIILVATGFFVQWPTIITAIMFPFIVGMYLRLAKKEEKDVEKDYRVQYVKYRQRVPAFIPKLNWRRRTWLRN